MTRVTARRSPAGSPLAPTTPRVSYLVFRLERRIRAQLDETLARHGVTTTEYLVLSELRLRDGPSSAELARIAFVTPQAMNLVIRDLEQRELIRREPHPDGGRILRSRLTRKGLAVVRRCDETVDRIEDVMLAGLDAAARETLMDSLSSCAQALHGAAGSPARGGGTPPE